MELKNSSKKQKENSTKTITYYYLKYNEKLSSFVSNEIANYRKDRKKEILINSIFFDEESFNLFFISFSNNLYYLTITPVISKEKNLKEIELSIPKNKFFEYDSMKLSEDRKHLVLFNEEKNKLFIIFNYLQKISIGSNINLENYYENKKFNIKDIKFNNNSLINEDLIIYGIICFSNESKFKYLSLFNNNYLGKEFQISLEESSFLDFQIVNNVERGCDLYIMNSFGNFKVAKNINNINNIPKSIEDDKFKKLKIYNKIAYNINNYGNNFNANFIKFNFQFQNELNEKMKNPISMINVLRHSKNELDIGILISSKIFIIKKYCLDEDVEEIIDDIIPINNILNKYIIKSNKNIYFLDIPPLSHICLSLKTKSNNKDENDEQIKHELLLTLREIISKINLSIIMKLPINNNNIPTIIYNFFKGSILFIKKYKLDLILRIYDFEIEDSNIYQNNPNNYILYKKDIDKEINEQNMTMEKVLNELNAEIEISNKKENYYQKRADYIKKILGEFSENMNKILNNKDSIKNDNNYINQINEWYINLYMSLMLLGKQIQDKKQSSEEDELKKNEFENYAKKDDEMIEKAKNDITKKIDIINKNQKRLQELREENSSKIYNIYLRAMNRNNEGKNYSNELVKRIINENLANIQFLKENIQKNHIYENVNLQKLKNFPLTIKYMNDEQKNVINQCIEIFKQLAKLLKQFKENIKKAP